MTETTGRRVRIENRNPDGKKILSGGRITVDGEDISSHVLRADIHLDPRELPTAVIEMVGLDLDVEALEADVQFVKITEGGAPSPDEPLTQKDLGLLRLQLADLQATRVLCFPCLIERHNGEREQDALPAMVIFNRNGICKDHFKIQDGPAPLPDRTPSGFILPNGPVNGGH